MIRCGRHEAMWDKLAMVVDVLRCRSAELIRWQCLCKFLTQKQTKLLSLLSGAQGQPPSKSTSVKYHMSPTTRVLATSPLANLLLIIQKPGKRPATNFPRTLLTLYSTKLLSVVEPEQPPMQKNAWGKFPHKKGQK